MKRIQITLGLLLAVTVATPLRAQVSAFTYQGRLDLNGAPAKGHYDFMFRLLNDPTNGVAAPVIPIALAVPVSNGLFTTGMDFGAENFDGVNRWLEINVRTNGGGPFTTLSPRQLLTPAPYAIASHTASNLLGTLPAGQISGTIPNASLPASPTFSGTVTAINFSGNGADLTNVSATTLGGLSSSNFWRTTGNAGTTAGTHFLGTTDNQPLELRVNNQRGLRLMPGGSNSVNVIGGSPGNGIAPGVVGAIVAGGGAADWFGFAVSNRVDADFSTVSGGVGNTIEFAANSAVIAGGANNTVDIAAYMASIGGGNRNRIQTAALNATITGGENNTIQISAESATIGGGRENLIQTNADLAVISGGYRNRIENYAEFGTFGGAIGGGQQNAIQTWADGAAIGGGRDNTIGIQAKFSTIAGGIANTNQTFAISATIGGGSLNTIQPNGWYATIPGGKANSATNYAFAAGTHAKADHTGAFVWADASFADDLQQVLTSTNANSVTMRGSGGYRLFTDTNATTGAFLAAGSGSWTSMSDRNAKENFRAADGREVLEKVIALPVPTWNYKSQDAGIRHIGPMAQDFQAAFGVGECDTGIATVDADGVALAAIQGLNEKVEVGGQRSGARIQKLEAENAELKQRLTELERAVQKLDIVETEP